MKSFAHPVVALSLPVLLALATGNRVVGSETPNLCADCHDEVVAAFAANPHATSGGGSGADRCLACHRGASDHAAADGDKALVTVPRGAEGAAICLSCHAGRGANGIDPKGVHGERGITCDTCHAMHPAGIPPEALLRQAGSSGCVACHPHARGEFSRPYTHPMHASVDGSGAAGLQCASCHNPHGGRNADSLKRDGAGEMVCVSCHTDKRGPFVYTHPALVVGSCTSCHEPHGSANAAMLQRARVQQLCLECHTGTPGSTLGSQPPSFHDLRSPRYQNCTTCHVAIHGSNTSPLLVR
jgi:DmsE family decaheme c-type cytochrome